MKYKKVKLGEVCTMSSGGTPSRSKHEYYGGSILWAKISDIENAKTGIITETEEKITEQGLKAINNRIFETNTLLLAMYGSVGKTAITGCRLSTNQAILGIRPSKDDIISLHFLKFWLQYKKADLLNRAVGGTLQNISLGIVKNLEIPLPDLPTQRHIAEVLDKADALRQQNRQLLALYDQLLQSTFIELFGDPVKNPKGWEVKKLGEVCKDIVDCPHSTPNHKNVPTDYPSIRTTEIKNGTIEWSSMKYVEIDEYNLRTRKLKPSEGDIVYGREGSFGDAIIIPKNTTMCLGQRVVLLRVNEKICNNIFFWSMVRSDYVYNQAVKKTSGSTVGHVNVKDIKLFLLILPPLPLQAHFAQIVEQIEVQKAQVGRSLAESEALFAGLLAGYFG